jgi:hypothetical protein
MALEKQEILLDGPTLNTLQTLQKRMPLGPKGRPANFGLVIRDILATHPSLAPLLSRHQAAGRQAHVRRVRQQLQGLPTDG